MSGQSSNRRLFLVQAHSNANNKFEIMVRYGSRDRMKSSNMLQTKPIIDMARVKLMLFGLLAKSNI